MDNLNGLSVALGGNMPLLCPAQGFPVPSHRYGTLDFGARNNSRGLPNEIYGTVLVWLDEDDYTFFFYIEL